MELCKDLGATASACMLANAVTHPLEMIKTRQMISGGGTIMVLSSTVRSEGMWALYKGITPALARGAVSGGGRLTGYFALKNLAISHGFLTSPHHPAIGPVAEAREVGIKGVLAIVSGVVAQLAAAPFDLARTRQSLSQGQPLPMGKMLVEVLRTEGLAGWFAGVVPLLGRTVTFNLGQLLTYDASKDATMSILKTTGSSDPADHVVASVPASAVAGLAATFASCPAENVKTVMQANESNSRSMTQTISWMFREHGVASFWRGWVPLYVKLAPHTLFVFYFTEQFRGVLGVESLS